MLTALVQPQTLSRPVKGLLFPILRQRMVKNWRVR